MQNIVLKIYDKSGKNVVKMYEAQAYDLPFGTVRKLMELVKIEELDNQYELLKIISGAWDEIIGTLNAVFPECTQEEWDSVKARDVLAIIIQVAKSVISDIFIIPTDEKN